MRKKHIKEWGETLSGPRPAGMPPENQPSYSWSPSQPRPMEFGRSDLSDSRAIDNINNSLDRALDTYYLTPYIALERIRKVLAPFGIVVPAVVFMNSDGGSRVFPISQWGGTYGTTGKAFDPMNPVDTNIEVNPEYNLYYTWAYDRTRKVYNVYARIVNTEKLSELLAMNEDNLQELSRPTLAKYIERAHVSGTAAAADQENAFMRGRRRNYEKYKRAGLTGQKREQGIKMAARKLAREDKVDEATIFKFPGPKKKPEAPTNKYAGTWEGGKEPHTPPAGDPRVDKTALRAREYYKKHGRMPPDLA